MRMMVSPDNEEYLDGDIVLFTCTLTDPTSSSSSPTWFQEDLIELRTARCDSPGDFERDVAHLYTYQSGCDVGVIYEKNVTISQHCQVKCVDSHNRVSVIKQFKIPNRKIYSTTRKPIINGKTNLYPIYFSIIVIIIIIHQSKAGHLKSR